MIESGDFVLTPDGLVFDEKGHLRNGQHRLHAIVRAGRPVVMQVARNASEQEIAAIDRGVTRHVADVAQVRRRDAELIGRILRLTVGTRRASAPDIARVLASPVGAAVQTLHSHCSSTAAYYSAVAMRMAAVTHMCAGSADDWNYILDLYRALALMDIPALPPVALSLVKQVSRRVAPSPSSAEAHARAMVVFDPARRNATRLVMDVESAAREIRQMQHILSPAVRQALARADT